MTNAAINHSNCYMNSFFLIAPINMEIALEKELKYKFKAYFKSEPDYQIVNGGIEINCTPFKLALDFNFLITQLFGNVKCKL